MPWVVHLFWVVLRFQVEAMMKANHDRAADALRTLLPALHRDMLKPAPDSASTNGSGMPEIQVSMHAR